LTRLKSIYNYIYFYGFIMPGQGNVLTIPEKRMILEVKNHFDNEKKRNKSIVGSASSLTATTLKLSVITVQRVLKEYKENGEFSDPKPKGASPYAVDSTIKTVIQNLIRQHNIKRDHLSIRSLCAILKNEYDTHIPRETLRAYLSRWNIVYGTVHRHSALREQDHVIAARRAYLIKKKELNLSDRTLIYLDETFINKNYSGSDTSWYCADWQEDEDLDKFNGPYINKPAGKGERLIILKAMTADGWIEGTDLIFKAHSNTGDYHGSMDVENFTRWFTKQLLPNIPDNSVIIMDNASYHNAFEDDGVPSLNSKKAALQEWLNHEGISFDEDYLRPQLIELVNQHRPKREYHLDALLKNNQLYRDRNITIMRTPQYHPELQPIEKCWAVMKQDIGRNCDFTMKGLRKNLDEVWGKFTKKTFHGIMKKVSHWEEYHFNQDGLLDEVEDAECI
jgi:transposase